MPAWTILNQSGLIRTSNAALPRKLSLAAIVSCVRRARPPETALEAAPAARVGARGGDERRIAQQRRGALAPLRLQRLRLPGLPGVALLDSLVQVPVVHVAGGGVRVEGERPDGVDAALQGVLGVVLARLVVHDVRYAVLDEVRVNFNPQPHVRAPPAAGNDLPLPVQAPHLLATGLALNEPPELLLEARQLRRDLLLLDYPLQLRLVLQQLLAVPCGEVRQAL